MIWKDIKGYEGIYKISEYGHVVSYPTKQLRKLKQGIVEITIKEKYLKATGQRYKRLWLCDKDGKDNRKSFSLHTLVYKTFIGEIEIDKVINHIDNDRNNNHYSNLEQITQKENVRHYHNLERKENNLKRCKCCKVEKSLNDFYIKPGDTSWITTTCELYRAKCKECMRKEREKRKIKNKFQVVKTKLKI
jgi:hypothetical protein